MADPQKDVPLPALDRVPENDVEYRGVIEGQLEVLTIDDLPDLPVPPPARPSAGV